MNSINITITSLSMNNTDAPTPIDAITGLIRALHNTHIIYFWIWLGISVGCGRCSFSKQHTVAKRLRATMLPAAVCGLTIVLCAFAVLPVFSSPIDLVDAPVELESQGVGGELAATFRGR
jgi:hypothetical protein